ncbi:thermostable 8-oxoguanine DNA glycosylase [Rhodovulum visakhapatnamense]|uniref:Thermostable 8-oxoguanine DNA glycosylase n=1 Tax=Rhodovulum visakhapatnamense TaxID=364297 RepID=A0A4R8FLJ6_9RHOB|nr:thermostable 8-oxoguanine DNA glycosylase [Rhodovulum visakhapatnamense]
MEICEASRSRSPCASPPLHANGQAEILPGVAMGRPDVILSPAYWRWRCQHAEEAGEGYVARESTLHEELGFCLLGGYGVRVEVNDAFFRHLRERGVFEWGARPSEEDLFDLLSERIPVADARGETLQRYRFPRQKAARLARSLAMADELTPERPVHAKVPRAFRNRLMAMPGVGPKTASWIARNWLGAEDVAILDIHILRLGRYLRLFPDQVRLPADYERLEVRFVAFAEALEVRPSILDAVIWDDMRRFGSRMVARATVGYST